MIVAEYEARFLTLKWFVADNFVRERERERK